MRTTLDQDVGRFPPRMVAGLFDDDSDPHGGVASSSGVGPLPGCPGGASSHAPRTMLCARTGAMQGGIRRRQPTVFRGRRRCKRTPVRRTCGHRAPAAAFPARRGAAAGCGQLLQRETRRERGRGSSRSQTHAPSAKSHMMPRRVDPPPGSRPTRSSATQILPDLAATPHLGLRVHCSYPPRRHHEGPRPSAHPKTHPRDLRS